MYQLRIKLHKNRYNIFTCNISHYLYLTLLLNSNNKKLNLILRIFS